MTRHTSRRRTITNSGYTVTALFRYGPFTSRIDADNTHKKVTSIKNAFVSAIKKSGNRYTFTSKISFLAPTKIEATKASKLIKQRAPSASVSIRQNR